MTIKAGNLVAELVIVGGGGAGLAAALAAAENGCRSIIVLEKAGSPAVSTAMAHDVFGAESPVQKRAGVDARWQRGDTAPAKCISCNKCLAITARGEPLECGEERRRRGEVVAGENAVKYVSGK